jgi:DNA (cytosine-5)-methyltransferase 1
MSPYRFTHGSLFSGIGGFDLAAEWMGWENIFHCEWNAFGQKVLKHYWPNAISYEDITKTDFTIHRGRIDILTGGFPCQPYSSAGKRLGKEDDRHLWPEMLRAIREIQPMYVVGENVRGLTNWNGGMVFDEVQADLEAQGYEVLPFLLPACAVNAPHRRDRIWFVANSINNRHSTIGGKISKKNRVSRINREKMESREFNGTNLSRDASHTNSNGLNECNSNDEINTSQRGKYALGDTNKSDGDGDASDSSSIRHECRKERKCPERWTQSNDQQFERCSKFYRANFEMFPTQSPICIGDDGISDRLDSITFPKWRNESIKAGGNAIVPQVAYQIFKALSL